MSEYKVYELTKKEVIKRNKIHNTMIEQMKVNGTYKEPYIDMASQYIDMWEVTRMLKHDISIRGVQIYTERGFKKNDSVALLANLNKQMWSCLEKLGLSTSTIKSEVGGDI